MKNALYIAYYTILRNFRDIKSMANMLLMPIILVLILGNALGSAFEVKDLSKSTVLILNQDKGHISEEFINILKSPDLEELIEVENIDSAEEAEAQVKAKKAQAYVWLGEDFSKNIMEGKKDEISIHSAGQGVAAMVLENVADSFVNYINMNQALAGKGIPPVPVENRNFIKTVTMSAKNTIPTAMDYYAVTMLVLVTLYGSLYAVNGIAEDYIEKMKARLRSTPVSQVSHYSGKIAGMVVTVFTQVIVLVLFTKFVYKATWGNNYGMLILISLSMSILSVTMGVAMAMIFKRSNTASAAVSSIIPIMTFLSGGYMKFNIDTPFFNIIRKILPSSIGQNAFFNLIYGDSLDRVFVNIGAMWLLIVLLGAVAVLCGRRRAN